MPNLLTLGWGHAEVLRKYGFIFFDAGAPWKCLLVVSLFHVIIIFAMLFRQRKQFQFGLNFANHAYWASVHRTRWVWLCSSTETPSLVVCNKQGPVSFPIGQSRSDTARLDVHWPCVALIWVWVPKPPNKTAKILFPPGQWRHVKKGHEILLLSITGHMILFLARSLPLSTELPILEATVLCQRTSHCTTAVCRPNHLAERPSKQAPRKRLRLCLEWGKRCEKSFRTQ